MPNERGCPKEFTRSEIPSRALSGLGDDHFERVGGGMGGKINSDGSLNQRELVRDERTHIEFPFEDQARNFVLEEEIRGITSNKVLFIDANRGEIEVRVRAAAGMREKEDLAAAAHSLLGLEYKRVGGRRDHGGVASDF